MPSNIENPAAPASESDEAALYEAAYLELESPQKDLGAWARALAQADGDLERARARYVQWRVAKMRAALGPRPTQPPPQVSGTTAATLEPKAPSPVPPPSKSGNYLLRHWRGDLSLPKSYWINGSLIGALLGGLGGGLGAYLPQSGYSLKAVVAISQTLTIVIIVYWIWSSVGIWRSADRRISEGKGKGWTNLAKVSVSLGGLVMVSKLVTLIVPNVIDEMNVLIGADPYGSMEVKVSSDGRALIFKGGLGAGATDRVKVLLDAAPAIRTLQLDSFGGRSIEAEHLAKLVRERHLDTYVEDKCVSACTYVFLAGNDRAATPRAKIGFHKPSTAGIQDAVEERDAMDNMARIYRDDNIPEYFIKRVVNTNAADMWYPTRDELIRANVITRVSLGDEVAPAETIKSREELQLAIKSEAIFRALDRRFPGSLDEVVDNAWAAYQAGKPIGEVMSAGREVLGGKILAALHTSSPEQMERFVALMADEMGAARAISPQACIALLNGTLNPAQAFSPELMKENQDTTIGLFSVDPAPPLSYTLDDLIAFKTQLQQQMAVRELQIAAGKLTRGVSDQERCDANLHFYRLVGALPENAKLAALHEMFQSQ